MSEGRLCPVCENEIPEDARFLCPHCHFELKWLDDEEAIQDARQNFTGELFTDMDNSDLAGRQNESNRLNGWISIIVGLAIFIWWFSSEFGLPGLFNDCWIGGFCLVLMVPGAVSIIFLVVGFINLLKNT